jgi:hypothetical protein
MLSPSAKWGGDFAPGWRAIGPWLLLSLLAHAAWLMPRATPRAPAVSAPALRVQLPRPASAPAEPDALAELAEPDSANGRQLVSTLRAPQGAQSTSRLARARRSDATLPAAAAAARPAAAASAPSAAPQWPASGRWSYRLQWRGAAGQAWLEWHQDGARYRLALQRRVGERSLPDWHSEGRLGAGGLQPENFSAGRVGRAGRDLHEQVPPPGVQDRLSWIWQAALLARSAQPPLRPGDRLNLQVTGWRGEVQDWPLQIERDAERPQWLLLRRLLPAGALLDQRLWLDPARGFLPVRLWLRFDDAERWGMELDDSAPPVATSSPSGPREPGRRDETRAENP